MQHRWLGMVVLAGCGGGSGALPDATPVPDAPADAPFVTLVDAPVDAPLGGPCNALTQAGCSVGQKCTWIRDQDNPPLGHVGCAVDPGAIGLAIGAACATPPAGPQGYDSCVRGSVCVGGVCKQICDNQGGDPMCDQNHACQRYAGLFEAGGVTVAGVCDPGCDPLTQSLLVGPSLLACGSTTASMPTRGCYGYDSYSCAPAGMTVYTLTDRMPPRTNASGNPYLNGCAPGFIPFFYAATGSTMTLCTGYCAALEIDNTPAHAGNTKGDPNALAKLPTAPAPLAGDGTCDIGKKGSHASSTCKFIWPYLTDATTGMLPARFANGPLLDTLGVCQAIAFFSYDSDNDMTPDMPFPDCSTLPPHVPGDLVLNDDAADWGCQKYSSSQFTSGSKLRNPALDDIRIGGGSPVPMLRHTFD